jgi:hypothetical protein
VLTGCGKNVVLPLIAAMERREAPHPYVIGVRAVATARRAASWSARVRRCAPGASRRSISLACEGAEKGKGAPGARKFKYPGGAALAASGCLTSESDDLRGEAAR